MYEYFERGNTLIALYESSSVELSERKKRFVTASYKSSLTDELHKGNGESYKIKLYKSTNSDTFFERKSIVYAETFKLCLVLHKFLENEVPVSQEGSSNSESTNDNKGNIIRSIAILWHLTALFSIEGRSRWNMSRGGVRGAFLSCGGSSPHASMRPTRFLVAVAA